MAAMIKYLDILRSELDHLPIIPGQIYYCGDSRETFYDSNAGIRVQMGDVIYNVETEAEREALIAPVEGKLYYIKESGLFYVYDNDIWSTVSDTLTFEEITGDITSLTIGTIIQKGIKRAPRTLTTAVYRARDGKVLDDILNEVGESFYITTQQEFSTSNMPRVKLAGAGNPNSALAFGGTDIANSSFYNNTEIYNGVSWSNSGRMSVGRAELAGCGASNAALAINGGNASNPSTSIVETFNGVGWSNHSSTNHARNLVSACGTTSSALVVGDLTMPDLESEIYNGQSWSMQGTLNAPRYSAAISGSANNALLFGGTNGQTVFNSSEFFNGLTWAIKANMVNSRRDLGGCGSAIHTTISVGGSSSISDAPDYSAIYIEKYTEDVWAIYGTAVTGRYQHAVVGDNSSGLIFAGSTGSDYALYNEIITSQPVASGLVKKLDKVAEGYEDRIITSTHDGDIDVSPIKISDTVTNPNGVWSAVAPMLYNRDGIAGAGTSAAAIAAGGSSNTTSVVASAIRFDGTNWSAAANDVISRRDLGACGTSNSALFAGGQNNNSVLNNVTLYNGTTWSAGPAMSVNIARFGINGTRNSTIVAGGFRQARYQVPTNVALKFNGTAWSTISTLPAALAGNVISGNADNAITFGGESPAGTFVYSSANNTWSASPHTISLIKGAGSGNGTQNAMAFGGTTANGYSQIYNGRYWTASMGMLTSRTYLGGLGEGINGSLAIGGTIGSTYSSIVESFNTSEVLREIGSRLKKFLPNRQDELITSTLEGEAKLSGTKLSDISTTTILSSDSALNTARYVTASSAGSDSALVYGGNFKDLGDDRLLTSTEQYDGVSWSTLSGADLSMPRSEHDGTGNLNTTIATGGLISSPSLAFGNTEIFNGSTWSTSSNDQITQRRRHAITGSSEGAIVSGGLLERDNDSNITISSEIFDGSTWSTMDALMILSVCCHSACGNSSLSFVFGGKTDRADMSYNGCTANSQFFDGFEWCLKDPLNIQRRATAGCKVSDSVVAYGGYDYNNSAISSTEKYDGQTWSIGPYMLADRAFDTSTGGDSCGIVTGGINNNNNVLDLTEKFNTLKVSEVSADNTETLGAINQIVWAVSDINLNAPAIDGVSCGNKNSILVFGHKTDNPEGSASIETQLISCGEIVWIGATMATSRSSCAGCGSSTSAIAIAGYDSIFGEGTLNNIERFNSDSWSSITATLPIGGKGYTSCGSSTNALIIGSGYNIYNLNNDTISQIEARLNTSRKNATSCGIASSALIIGGYNSTVLNIVEEYNGSICSTISGLNVARQELASSGNTSAALVTGSSDSYTCNITEYYNGDTWYVAGNLNMPRTYHSDCGTALSAASIGGYTDTGSTIIELGLANTRSLLDIAMGTKSTFESIGVTKEYINESDEIVLI